MDGRKLLSCLRFGLPERRRSAVSRSCFSSTSAGASHIRSDALVVFGKAITSRIESAPASIAQTRSNPSAIPPWGGAPDSSARAGSRTSPRLVRSDRQRAEHALLDVAPVDTDRSARDLRAVEHEIVGLRASTDAGSRVELVEVFPARGGERMVHRHRSGPSSGRACNSGKRSTHRRSQRSAGIEHQARRRSSGGGVAKHAIARSRVVSATRSAASPSPAPHGRRELAALRSSPRIFSAEDVHRAGRLALDPHEALAPRRPSPTRSRRRASCARPRPRPEPRCRAPRLPRRAPRRTRRSPCLRRAGLRRSQLETEARVGPVGAEASHRLGVAACAGTAAGPRRRSRGTSPAISGSTTA